MYNFTNLTEQSTIMRIGNIYYFYFSHYMKGEMLFDEVKNLITVSYDDLVYRDYFIAILEETRDESCSKKEFENNQNKYNFIAEIKNIK